MSDHKHLKISEVGDVTVVQFIDRKILDDVQIQEIGQEFNQLVESDGKRQLLLSFASVEFLSSSALGKLISLDKLVKQHNGVLKMSNIRPEIMEVFTITRLNKLFDIKDDISDALSSFKST